MKRIITEKKSYKVSGKIMILLNELCCLYEKPHVVFDYGTTGADFVITEEYLKNLKNTEFVLKKTGDNCIVIPFPNEKRDYLIGKLVEAFNSSIEEIEE